MGSKLSRSSSARSDGSKSKWKRGKRKHAAKLESPVGIDKFSHQHNHEPENSVANLNETYEKWNKRVDQQEISNYNVDPPGAPSTFSSAYPMASNDPRDRTWSSPHDVTNHFYQGSSLPMTAGSSVAYDMNHYMPAQMPATVSSQSQQILSEERSSKKVQFNRTVQQQSQAPPRNILINTQSWHEQSNMTNDMSNSPKRHEPTSNRQSVHRTLPSTVAPSTAQTAVQKPIYVGIDHRATLAERGQTTIHRRHHKSSDKASSDTSASTTNNQRTRTHAHHQHKHQDVNEGVSSKATMKSNRSFERLQAKLSGSNRPMSTTSTIIANKQTEQPVFNDVEIRVPRSRGGRHTQSQHIEQQTLVDNEIRPSRSRGNHSHSKQQQQPQHQQSQPPRSSGSRNNSPLRTETPRRVDNKHHNAPLMKIAISQPQRQKQSGAPLAVSTPPTVNRARI